MPAIYWTNTTSATPTLATTACWIDNGTATSTSDTFYFYDNGTRWIDTSTATTASNTLYDWWTNTGGTYVRRYVRPIYTAPEFNNPPYSRPTFVPAAPAIQRRRPVAELARQTIRQLESAKRTKRADRVAGQLLLSHLTPDQRETLLRNRWFIVEGGRSKQRYRIRDSGHLVANIDVLDGDRVTHRLCAHLRDGGVPIADHLLCQKIMLELAEDDFLKIANRHAA